MQNSDQARPLPPASPGVRPVPQTSQAPHKEFIPREILFQVCSFGLQPGRRIEKPLVTKWCLDSEEGESIEVDDNEVELVRLVNTKTVDADSRTGKKIKSSADGSLVSTDNEVDLVEDQKNSISGQSDQRNRESKAFDGKKKRLENVLSKKVLRSKNVSLDRNPLQPPDPPPTQELPQEGRSGAGITATPSPPPSPDVTTTAITTHQPTTAATSSLSVSPPSTTPAAGVLIIDRNPLVPPRRGKQLELDQSYLPPAAPRQQRILAGRDTEAGPDSLLGGLGDSQQDPERSQLNIAPDLFTFTSKNSQKTVLKKRDKTNTKFVETDRATAPRDIAPDFVVHLTQQSRTSKSIQPALLAQIENSIETFDDSARIRHITKQPTHSKFQFKSDLNNIAPPPGLQLVSAPPQTTSRPVSLATELLGEADQRNSPDKSRGLFRPPSRLQFGFRPVLSSTARPRRGRQMRGGSTQRSVPAPAGRESRQPPLVRLFRSVQKTITNFLSG